MRVLIKISNHLAFLLYPLQFLKFVLKRDREICVIKLSAMGDVLCLLPTLKFVYSKGNPVTLITTSRANPGLISTLMPELNIIVLNPLKPKAILYVIYKIAKSKYSIDCDQYYSISSILAKISHESIGFSNVRKKTYVDSLVPYINEYNEKQNFMNLFSIFQYITTQDYMEARKSLQKKFINSEYNSNKYLVFYPGSSPNAIFRRVPLNIFLEVYEKFITDRVKIFAIGPDELSYISNISEYNSDILAVYESLNYWIELFINNDVIFIGNDAGLLHLAEICGAKTIGLFGPNLSSKWGALLNSHDIDGNCEYKPCIRVDRGEIPSKCKLSKQYCMETITDKEILAMLERVDNDTSSFTS